MPTTFVNSINSNPIYAARAEMDASGNVITTTYATKAELPSDELPAKSASDAGKALVVNSAGTGVEWSSVGGGTTYTFTDGIDTDINDNVFIVGSQVANILAYGSATVGYDAVGTAGLRVNQDGFLEVDCDEQTISLQFNDLGEAKLTVLNPLPEMPGTASDEGKVLVIATDGEGGDAPAWATLNIPTIGTVSI